VDEWTNAGIVGIEQYCMYLTSLFLPSIYNSYCEVAEVTS